MSTRNIQPGETVRLYWGTDRQADFIVGMPCSDTAPGHWYCATHPKASVPNNISMAGHCESPGKHVEVWICHEHGAESPAVIVKPEA